VSECDRDASTMRRPWLTRGCRAIKKKSHIMKRNVLGQLDPAVCARMGELLFLMMEAEGTSKRVYQVYQTMDIGSCVLQTHGLCNKLNRRTLFGELWVENSVAGTAIAAKSRVK
jgi:hypothetical protein